MNSYNRFIRKSARRITKQDKMQQTEQFGPNNGYRQHESGQLQEAVGQTSGASLKDLFEPMGKSDHQQNSTEAYILGLLRAWVKITSYRQTKGNCASSDAEFFKVVNWWQRVGCVTGGLCHLRYVEKMMTLIACTSSKIITMGCRCCGRVSADEGMLLKVFLDLQEGKIAKARAAVASILDAEHRDDLLHFMLLLVVSLVQHNRYFNRHIIAALQEPAYQKKHQ